MFAPGAVLMICAGRTVLAVGVPRRDQTVDFVQSHHHGALHHGVLQFFQCFFWRHTFGFAHFDQ